jgi:choline dehydrogenase
VNFEASFDYIIIGAGASGCVIAHRLSANPNTKVLLLEAGGMDNDPAIQRLDLPSLLSLWGPDLDWGFVTEEEPGLNGRKIQLLQGKVLGGGTSINGRTFFRGNRRNFDHWDYLGNEGWNYEGVLPYFKKLENYMGKHPSDLRGTDGPVPIIELPEYTPAARRFVDAAVELGFGGNWDFNGPQQEGGAGLAESTTYPDSLTRATTASAYVHPIMERPNFTLETEAHTTRLLFEADRAVGVEYLQHGTIRQVQVTSEVIVSAGGYNTPKLLMLSGVGPADHLRSFGIPVVVDLPGVGQNLQDHLIVQLCFSSTIKQTPRPMIICESSLFTHIHSGIESASPDLQFFFGGFLFPELLAKSGEGMRGMTLCPVIAQPHSVGSVSLRSSDPLDMPVIRANFLTSDRDVDVLVKGIALGRELFQTRAFDDMRGEEVRPGPHVRSQKELRQYIRNTCNTDWHPSCSCRMGHDVMAVVDPQLRVREVRGLRVADASVMPSIISGNINGVCVMIGEKAADMILNAG